eukprot:TRINITY_DN16697_c0_g1_i2.p1 TRINITY_DN16697_c0_g1~~TRINITY_DN16697_c0_g1_i2.p1  ORF type:complete len:889 (+),score=95.38 TRINITY_DN16697_c0_g1_i2:104-2770(+)
MRFTVNVPSYVAVTNSRLVFTYYILEMFLSALFAYQFYSAGLYQDSFPLDQAIHVRFETLEPVGKTSWDEASSWPLCTAPLNYAYGYDENSSSALTGCSSLCGNHPDNQDGCIRFERAFKSEQSNSEAFLTTCWRKKRGSADGTVAVEERFLPEALDVRVSVSFVVDFFSVPMDFFSKHMRLSEGRERGDVFTVVVKRQNTDSSSLGRRWVANRTFAHGTQQIQFTLRDLLELAGLEANLAAETPEKTTSVKAGDQRPPTIAMVGMRLVLTVACHNQPPVDISVAGWDPKAYAYMCILDVRPLRESRAKVSTYDATGENTYEYIDSSGIRITSQGGGEFHFFHLQSAFVNLCSILFFMRLPKCLIVILMTCSLGHLSRLYRRVIFRSFDVETEVAGLGARLMSSTIAFRELEHIAMHESMKSSTPLPQGSLDAPHIMPATIRRQLMFAMRERISQLHEDDLSAFVTFVNQSVCRYGQSNHRTAEQSQQAVTVDSFNVACCSNEMIDFDGLCKLFDAGRPMCFMERLFTPTHLSNAIFDAHLTEQERRNKTGNDDTDTMAVPRSSVLSNYKNRNSDFSFSGYALADENDIGERIEQVRLEMDKRLEDMRRAMEESVDEACTAATAVAKSVAEDSSRLRRRIAVLEARWKLYAKDGSLDEGANCLTCDELDPYVDVNVAACSTDIQALDVRLLRIENDFVSAASQRIADRHELFRLIDIFENEVAIAAGQRAMDRELLDRCASLLESIEDHGSRKNSMNDIGSVACCDNSMDQTVSVFANSLAPVRSNDCSDISTGLLASSCSDTSTGLLASSIEASAVDRMTLPSPSLLGASALQQDKGRPVKRLKVGLPENAQRGFVGRTSLRASTCSRAREEADAETANVVPLSIAI